MSLVDYTFNGTELAEHTIEATGAEQRMSHDNMFDVVIRTASSGGGTLLVADTDYVLSDYNVRYRAYNRITFAAGYTGQTLYVYTSKCRGDFFNTYNVNKAIEEGGGGEMAANSIKGNPTGSAASPIDITFEANKFLARASAGNLGAKNITDFGLGLVSVADAAAGRTALGAAPTANPVFTGFVNMASSDRVILPYTNFRSAYAGSYINDGNINNILFAADKRLTVTLNDFLTSDATHLFNGEFDNSTSNIVSASATATITIETASAYWCVYSYGTLILSGYNTSDVPALVKARWKDRYDTWQEYSEIVPTSNIIKLSIPSSKTPYTYGKSLEIVITAASGANFRLSSIEYFLSRPGLTETQIFDKSKTNSITLPVYFFATGGTRTGAIFPDSATIQISKISPYSDSVSALQLTKADGVTPVLTVDTTNRKVRISSQLYEDAIGALFETKTTSTGFATTGNFENNTEGAAGAGNQMLVKCGSRYLLFGVTHSSSTSLGGYGAAGCAFLRTTNELNLMASAAAGKVNIFSGHDATTQAEITAVSGKIGFLTSTPAESMHLNESATRNVFQIGSYGCVGSIYSSGDYVFGNNCKPAPGTTTALHYMVTHTIGARALVLSSTYGFQFHANYTSVTAGQVFSAEKMRLNNDGNLFLYTGYVEMNEVSAPGAGAANTGRLFLRDNGSGKTQLCVIFSSGDIQVLATQP